MDVTLYKNFSVFNKLTKNITQVAKYPAVQLVEPTGDRDLSIRMTVPTDQLRWDNVNYMEFDGAYYYVDDVEKVGNSITEVHGDMDLLMTYRSAILALDITASRSTSHGSGRLADDMRNVSVDSTRSVIKFPNQISEIEALGTYVLVTGQQGYTEAV